MTLRGSGMVIMWHDITAEGDGAYHLWHTHEHMPERIALPGFLRARRGVNRGLARQHYFTLYECEDLGGTVSPAYLQSLNFPSAWTQKVAPEFRNFKRMSCRTTATRGQGLGGSISTFRAVLPGGEGDLDRLDPALDLIMAIPSVTGVHIAVPEPAFTNGDTTEVKIRPAMTEPDFGVVVIVEGIGLAEIAADEARIADLLAQHGLGDIIAQSYDMAYMLDRASVA